MYSECYLNSELISSRNDFDFNQHLNLRKAKYSTISSFPDDATTIANIIDEFNFDHQVILQNKSNFNLKYSAN